MPLRGLIGSDVLKYRDDWKVIDRTMMVTRDGVTRSYRSVITPGSLVGGAIGAGYQDGQRGVSSGNRTDPDHARNLQVHELRRIESNGQETKILQTISHGVIVLAAAISPYRAVRDEVRAEIGDFIEVYVNAPLEVCEARDTKGLYQRARAGLIRGFTGIDDPYEPPLRPEVECRTDRETVRESVEKVLSAIDRALN